MCLKKLTTNLNGKKKKSLNHTILTFRLNLAHGPLIFNLDSRLGPLGQLEDHYWDRVDLRKPILNHVTQTLCIHGLQTPLCCLSPQLFSWPMSASLQEPKREEVSFTPDLWAKDPSAWLGLPLLLSADLFVVVQSLSCVQFLTTPWTAALLASLSFIISQSLLRLMSIESLISSNHLILFIPSFSCPQSLPASGSFPMSRLFPSGGQSIGASASASVLPMNIQGWFPLRLTSLISLLSRGSLQYHKLKVSIL